MISATFIGNLGTNGLKLNGQVIKATELLNLLRLYNKVNVVDTSNFKSFSKVFKIFISRSVYLSLGYNGLYYVLPLIFFVKKYLKSFKVEIFLVGGWIELFLQNHPRYWKYLSETRIYVESNTISVRLNTCGLNSCTFPNFRNLPLLKPKGLYSHDNKRLTFCFISRIIESKGVFKVIDLVNELNKRGIDVTVDFYGPIDPSIQSKFHSKLTYKINYLGCLNDSLDVLNTLNLYDFCVLPTSYPGECIPGILVESMMAGTPVIVTDFKFLNEIVINNFNGYIYDDGNFVNSICDTIKNLKLDSYLAMSRNCLQFVSEKQSIDEAKRILDVKD